MQISVEMVIDPMCPWCYIGLRRLQSALKLVESDGIHAAIRCVSEDPLTRSTNPPPEAGIEFGDMDWAHMGARLLLAAIRRTFSIRRPLCRTCRGRSTSLCATPTGTAPDRAKL